MATPDGPGRCPHTDGHAWADHLHPRQIPGMARLMELTPELWAHYADPGPACPYCGAAGDRIYERGQGAGFTRYRCKNCLGEFDVETPSEETR